MIGIEQAERLLAELSSQSFGTGTASAPGIGPITMISDANITTRIDPTYDERYLRGAATISYHR